MRFICKGNPCWCVKGNLFKEHHNWQGKGKTPWLWTTGKLWMHKMAFAKQGLAMSTCAHEIWSHKVASGPSGLGEISFAPRCKHVLRVCCAVRNDPQPSLHWQPSSNPGASQSINLYVSHQKCSLFPSRRAKSISATQIAPWWVALAFPLGPTFLWGNCDRRVELRVDQLLTLWFVWQELATAPLQENQGYRSKYFRAVLSPTNAGSSWHIIQGRNHPGHILKACLGLDDPFCMRIYMIHIQYICIGV